MPAPITTAANASVDTNRTEEITPLRPDEVPTVVPSYNSNIVSLQSLPGAKGLLISRVVTRRLYITPNRRSERQHDPRCGSAWRKTPFNINVTTDIKVYLQSAGNQPATRRVHRHAGDGGGVAFYGS